MRFSHYVRVPIPRYLAFTGEGACAGICVGTSDNPFSSSGGSTPNDRGFRGAELLHKAEVSGNAGSASPATLQLGTPAGLCKRTNRSFALSYKGINESICLMFVERAGRASGVELVLVE